MRKSVIAIVLGVVIAGCAARQAAAPVGWTCVPTYGGCDQYGNAYREARGTVGIPFRWKLLGSCNTAQWSVQTVQIKTGRLPPGLSIEPGSFDIVGVPAGGGSFSFQMEFVDLTCPGSQWMPHAATWYDQFTIVTTGN